MGSELAQQLLTGSLLVGLPIAMLAGLVSFVSPCVLPLLPGYLSYVSGLAGTDIASRITGNAATGGANNVADRSDTVTVDSIAKAGRRKGTRRLVAGAVLFVLGFSGPFMLFGTAMGWLGSWLYQAQDVIARVMGVVLILMGLVFIGRISKLQTQHKLRISPRVGLVGAPLLGFTFGVGWTPCTGPVLTAIGTLSLTSGSTWQGVALTFAYCIGLGVPFVLVAFGFGWISGALGWVRKHIRVINVVGGICLIILGILLVTGLWSALILSIQEVISGYVTPI